MKTNKIIITLATAPVVTGAFLASALLSPVSAGDVHVHSGYACNQEADLQGTVNKNVATVTNHSTNESCNYSASLAVYESPKEPETYGWIEAQKYLASKTVSVKAGETVTFTVDYSSSACWFQSDLIRGGEDKVLKGVPSYRTAMDVDVWSQSCNAPTPTPTPGSSTGGNTTNNVTNNTTNNNTTNNVSNTTSEKLASTGDALTVAAFLLAGVVTLLSGMFLRKAGK